MDENLEAFRQIGQALARHYDSLYYVDIESGHYEQRCINMSASYLQGYKYSRPVPIEELRDFFSKIA